MNNSEQRGQSGPPVGKVIDMTERQRAIVQQIQEDQTELDRLETRRAQLLARINANRGKLDLIAELVEEYGAHDDRLATEE